MQAFLKITGIAFVIGKDEKGDDLQLTRVQTERYDQEADGSVGPDHHDEGSTLFVGNLTLDEATFQLQRTCLPEWNIKVIVGDGVENATA